MIHVVATIDLAEGKRDDFLQIFRQVVPKVHGEAGCLEYGGAIDLAADMPMLGPVRQNTVTVIERWESVETLQAHLASDHMVAFRENVKDLVKNIELKLLEPAS